jgi:Protein of unknown function (DUF4232)
MHRFTLFPRRLLGAAALASAAALVPVAALATTAATAAPARPAAATASPCSSADLEVWVAADSMNGAAGTLYYPLEFTNISTHTCTLYGHPGVSAIAHNGQQLGNPAGWGSSPAAHTVTLAPAATANAQLAYRDAVTGDCPAGHEVTSFELRVIPPDQTQSRHAFWPLPACTAAGYANFLGVQVITPGLGISGGTG